MVRKTEFWKSATPDKLGPGCYSVTDAPKIKQNKTAFLIKAKRQLSAPKPYNRFTPGPGAYNVSHEQGSSVSNNSCCFASKSKREIFPSTAKPNTPGPGSYESKIPSSASSKKRPKFSALYLDPSPVSIPSNDPQPSETVSEVSQNLPNKGTEFSKYKSIRKVFNNQNSTPGPGSYNLQPHSQIHSSWMFTSNIGRAESPKNQIPGPGYYSVTPANDGKLSYFLTAPKEVPLTNDPYRPILVGAQDYPPVGAYKLAEELKKNEKLKAKFITGDIPVKHIPFNTQEKREMPWVAKDQFPGPADYSVQRPKSTGANLKTTTSRFDKEKYAGDPGPGYYDTSLSEKEKKVIVNKSPRFVKIEKKTPEPYLGHKDWSVKRTRAIDFEDINPMLCFDSGQARFKQDVKKENLGPGCYDNRPATVSSGKVSKTERFKGHGHYRPNTGTNQRVGPGYYNPVNDTKKSFNFAKELNSEKIWL